MNGWDLEMMFANARKDITLDFKLYEIFETDRILLHRDSKRPRTV